MIIDTLKTSKTRSSLHATTNVTIHKIFVWHFFLKLECMYFGFTCYRPQRSCGQGNIFTPVCHSVHRGVSASVQAGIPPPSKHPPRADNPPGVDTPPPEQTPPGSRLRHTVNERPVRILLECILVCYFIWLRLAVTRCPSVWLALKCHSKYSIFRKYSGPIFHLSSFQHN